MSAASLVLWAVLDLRAAAPLKADLLANTGVDLDIDASKVERVGAPCLQLLLASSAAWSAAGRSLRVSAASDAFREDIRLMGAASLLPMTEAAGSATC